MNNKCLVCGKNIGNYPNFCYEHNEMQNKIYHCSYCNGLVEPNKCCYHCETNTVTIFESNKTKHQFICSEEQLKQVKTFLTEHLKLTER